MNEWINEQIPFSYSTNIYYWAYYLWGHVLGYLQRKSKKPGINLQTWCCLVSKQILCHICSLITMKLRQEEKTSLFSSFYLKYLPTTKAQRTATQTQPNFIKLSWPWELCGAIKVKDLEELSGIGALGEYLSWLPQAVWVLLKLPDPCVAVGLALRVGCGSFPFVAWRPAPGLACEVVSCLDCWSALLRAWEYVIWGVCGPVPRVDCESAPTDGNGPTARVGCRPTHPGGSDPATWMGWDPTCSLPVYPWCGLSACLPFGLRACPRHLGSSSGMAGPWHLMLKGTPTPLSFLCSSWLVLSLVLSIYITSVRQRAPNLHVRERGFGWFCHAVLWALNTEAQNTCLTIGRVMGPFQRHLQDHRYLWILLYAVSVVSLPNTPHQVVQNPHGAIWGELRLLKSRPGTPPASLTEDPHKHLTLGLPGLQVHVT